MQGISDKIAETTFLLATDAISSKTAQATLNSLQNQFDVLSNQADALSRTTNTFEGTPFGQAPSVTVNMGVVGDPEAAARAVVGIINDSYYRGTGGAGNYAGF